MADTTLIHQEAVPEKRSYSVAEIAEILGVSKRSVYNLCSAGVIKSVRIGTKLRISKRLLTSGLMVKIILERSPQNYGIHPKAWEKVCCHLHL